MVSGMRTAVNSVDNSPLPDNVADAKIKKFQSFVQDVLQPQMKAELALRDKLHTKLQIFIDLERNIEIMQETKQKKLSTMVDLGCDFYAQAVVPDCSRVCIDVGLDLHVEFTLEEALVHISERKKRLVDKADVCTKKAADISAKVKMVYESIGQLMQLRGVEPRREPRFL